MEQVSRYGMTASRFLVAMMFLLNATGVVDQSVAARGLTEHGAPTDVVPFLMLAGRSVELIGGIALVLGTFPRVAAIALMGFLVPATLAGHAFWATEGTQAFMIQLINFLKNIAMMGGLLFIVCTEDQPTIMRRIHGRIDNGALFDAGRKGQL